MADRDAVTDSAAESTERVRGNDESTERDGDEPPERADGGVNTHTIRLELADEPGELLAALQPIADNGGNLLSIFHERGNRTPRGRVPVEVDLSCPPDRFDAILEDLRASGVNVVQADAEEYADEVTVILVGELVDAGLSDTLRQLDAKPCASVADVTLDAPSDSPLDAPDDDPSDGDSNDSPASARVRLGAREGRIDDALATVRAVADRKGFDVIEPLGVEP